MTTERRSGRPPRQRPHAGRIRRFLSSLLLVLLLPGCGGDPSQPDASPSPVEGETPAVAATDLPIVDLDALEPEVSSLIRSARDRVVAEPTSSEQWGLYAAALDVHGLYQPALTCYARARELAPDDFRWTYLTAVAQTLEGEPPESVVATLEQAIELSPDYPTTYLRLGDQLLELGRIEEARDAYQQAIAVAPELAVAHRNLGLALTTLGETDEAIRQLLMAVAFEPQDGAAFAALAHAFTQAGETDKAEVAARRARERPNDLPLPDSLRLETEAFAVSAAARVQRAVSAMKNEDYLAAIRELTPVSRMRPDDLWLHLQLGLAYRQIGDPGQSLYHFRAAVNADGRELDELGARFQLGTLLAEQGQLGEAVYQLRKALDQAPRHAALALKLGALLAQNKEPGPARELVERAARLSGSAGGGSHDDWQTALLTDRELDWLDRRLDALQSETSPSGTGPLETLSGDDRSLAAGAHYLRGVLLELRDDLDRAIAEYRSATELDAENRAGRRLRFLARDAPVGPATPTASTTATEPTSDDAVTCATVAEHVLPIYLETYRKKIEYMKQDSRLKTRERLAERVTSDVLRELCERLKPDAEALACAVEVKSMAELAACQLSLLLAREPRR